MSTEDMAALGFERNETNWLALIYKMSALPSRNRVYTWRKLKEAGAVFIQHGVALLPMNQDSLALMQKLRKKILHNGGEAAISCLNFLNSEDEEKAEFQFNEGIRSEYDNIKKILEKTLEDLARKRESEKCSMEFLEDCLNSIHKTDESYEKIKMQDHFQSFSDSKLDYSIASASSLICRYLKELRNKTSYADC